MRQREWRGDPEHTFLAAIIASVAAWSGTEVSDRHKTGWYAPPNTTGRPRSGSARALTTMLRAVMSSVGGCGGGVVTPDE